MSLISIYWVQKSLLEGNRTKPVVKGCYTKIKSRLSQDHNLGGQSGQLLHQGFEVMQPQ